MIFWDSLKMEFLKNKNSSCSVSAVLILFLFRLDSELQNCRLFLYNVNYDTNSLFLRISSIFSLELRCVVVDETSEGTQETHKNTKTVLHRWFDGDVIEGWFTPSHMRRESERVSVWCSTEVSYNIRWLELRCINALTICAVLCFSTVPRSSSSSSTQLFFFHYLLSFRIDEQTATWLKSTVHM